MQSGIVKWFDDDKGFGFIRPDIGGQDVFVLGKVIEVTGRKTLEEGQAVLYESAETDKGPKATTVRPKDESASQSDNPHGQSKGSVPAA
jgi:CspA family cold shock protein